MKLNKVWYGGILAATALVAVGLIGCSFGQAPAYGTQSQPTGQSTLLISGLLPDWDLEDMVERSDAIAIGVITTNLGTKSEAGGLNDPPSYYYQFTDYKLEVERDFYPGTLPENIAFLAETGVTPGKEDIKVVGYEGVPSYELEDRVILFMESMADDSEFGDGAGRPVPDGFTADDYYLVIVGGPFGKLMLSGEKWEDSRTGESFTIDKLASVIH